MGEGTLPIVAAGALGEIGVETSSFLRGAVSAAAGSATSSGAACSVDGLTAIWGAAVCTRAWGLGCVRGRLGALGIAGVGCLSGSTGGTSRLGCGLASTMSTSMVLAAAGLPTGRVSASAASPNNSVWQIADAVRLMAVRLRAEEAVRAAGMASRQ